MTPIKINFFYKNNEHSYKKEIIITELCKRVSGFIQLPDVLDICLYDLGHHIYGGLDSHSNRIGINSNLSLDEIPVILIHELIHLNQKVTGIFKVDRNGVCHWYGVPYGSTSPEAMSSVEYNNLPWEKDVSNRLPLLLKRALAISH